MRSLSLLLMLVLGGCPPKPSPPPVSGPGLVLAEEEDRVTGQEVGPGPWSEPGGLSLVVPEGWAGRTGPEGSGLLLVLSHVDTGVQFELWAFASSGALGPRPRPGCEWRFTDAASHRLVPALAPAVTATCLAEDPLAPIIQGWYGRVEGREVGVEALYPPGRIIEGRQVVEPLLKALEAS